MTGKELLELLELLKTLNPEELDREIVVRYPAEDDYDDCFVTHPRAEATTVLARDVGLIMIEKKLSRNDLVPVIIIG